MRASHVHCARQRVRIQSVSSSFRVNEQGTAHTEMNALSAASDPLLPSFASEVAVFRENMSSEELSEFELSRILQKSLSTSGIHSLVEV